MLHEQNQGIDMGDAMTKGLRIGGIAMLATVLICGACQQSTAQAVEHSATQPREAANRAQLPAAAPASSSEQVRLGPMRYYGGPKSPMWRAPSAN
jgi:hypothetical protein